MQICKKTQPKKWTYAFLANEDLISHKHIKNLLERPSLLKKNMTIIYDLKSQM